jgi:hypothetical protein
MKPKVNLPGFLLGNFMRKSIKPEQPKAVPDDAFELDEFVVTPGDAYSNRYRDKFDYNEPDHIGNIRNLQKERGLPATGFMGPQTKQLFRDDHQIPEQDMQRADELTQRLEKLKSLREDYKNKVREQSKTLDNSFGMKGSVYNTLKGQNVSQLNQCIGGVCTFLDEKVEPGLFKNATQDGIYYSNNTFEENARQEGWQQHVNTELTKPDVGDIIVRFNPTTRTRHAVIVSDFDQETGKYTITDNDGGKNKRVRQFSEKELVNKYDIGKSTGKGNPLGFFFRRTDFGEGNIAEVQRELNKLNEFKVPEEYRHGQTYEHKGFELEQNATGKKSFNRFTQGVNASLQSANDLYKDIPEDHLQALALIAGGISGNESTFGKDGQLALEKGLGYTFAKTARNLKGTNDKSSPMSVGISQINPSMLDENILQKYFSKDKNMDKVAKKIASDPELQGKLTMEELATRYRRFRENPNLYGNDPEKFFYALTRSWKNPGFALSEKGKEYIENWDVDYSNAAMKNIDKYFDIKQKRMGGEMPCAECGGQFSNGGETGNDTQMWTPGMMFQPTNPIEAMLTGANEWMDPTSYKPEPIDMSGFDADFAANASSIDAAREMNIKNNPVGIDENVPRFIGDSELAGGPQIGDPQKEDEKFWNISPLETALVGLGALGSVNSMLEKRNYEGDYNRMLRSRGNTDNKYNANVPMGSKGDYTLNVGLGNNFRPDKTTYGRYQEGGEYQMSQEELDAFIASGGEVEIL